MQGVPLGPDVARAAQAGRLTCRCSERSIRRGPSCEGAPANAHRGPQPHPPTPAAAHRPRWHHGQASPAGRASLTLARLALRPRADGTPGSSVDATGCGIRSRERPALVRRCAPRTRGSAGPARAVAPVRDPARRDQALREPLQRRRCAKQRFAETRPVRGGSPLVERAQVSHCLHATPQLARGDITDTGSERHVMSDRHERVIHARAALSRQRAERQQEVEALLRSSLTAGERWRWHALSEAVARVPNPGGHES